MNMINFKLSKAIHPYEKRKLLVFSFLFAIYSILTLLLKIGLIPLGFINIDGIRLPTYQMVQFFVLFPFILLLTYLFFIRKKLIKWSELGFNQGNDGLLITLFYGLLGGTIQGTFVFFNSNHFLLKNQIFLNFFEKCISAPLWEEFLFRVLMFSMIELLMLLYLKRFSEYPKLNSVLKIGYYFGIIMILSAVFSYMHGELSIFIVSFAAIATLIYMKTRSIIAPIIAHSLTNFVAGGFFYLLLNLLF